MSRMSNAQLRRALLIAAVLCWGVIGLSHPGFAQADSQTPAAQPKVKRVSGTAKTTPKLTDEQKQGYALLETSEASSRGLEAPMRTYGLMQIATAYPTTGSETKKTRALLRDAFTSSLEIQDDNDTKQELQTEIFRALLPLSQEDVEELLSQAAPKVRKVTSEQMIRMYTSKKQFEKAIDLVNQVTSWDEFPYASASGLIDALPADMTAEKQGLLVQAVNSYKNHTHKGMNFGEGTLSGMIVKNYGAMNPKLVLQAIDEILSQAKSTDENNNHNNNISLGGTGGTVSFTSQFDYELFALMPVLQRLDESRANSLLQENRALQAKLQQFPDGTQSITPPAPPQPDEAPSQEAGGKKAPGKEGTETKRKSQAIHTSVFSGDAATAARMQAVQGAMNRTQQIVDEAETDPGQALAHATTLPVVLDGMFMMSPRGNALTAVARAAAKNNPAIAKQALADLRKIVPDMALDIQARSLQNAITTYIVMGDNDGAESAISEGIKVAERLLEKDLNPDDPNKALKAWWPSANAYRSFVEAQTKVSRVQTLALLKEIKDPEIRTIESITYARTMLGLPTRQDRIQEKRKSMNRTMITDSD
ncbi:MAG TPA: hypothetical protein VFR08_05685 [Candidatus Angelobacter sp.]|nr:hypothetical protein [Candidatus Angelobacter sp.]